MLELDGADHLSRWRERSARFARRVRVALGSAVATGHTTLI